MWVKSHHLDKKAWKEGTVVAKRQEPQSDHVKLHTGQMICCNQHDLHYKYDPRSEEEDSSSYDSDSMQTGAQVNDPTNLRNPSQLSQAQCTDVTETAERTEDEVTLAIKCT